MISHEEIARVAHELYEKSGRVPGREIENWLEAERIVKARHGYAEGDGNGGEKSSSREAAGRREIGGKSRAPQETIAAEKASSRKRAVTRTTAKEEPKKTAPRKPARTKKAE